MRDFLLDVRIVVRVDMYGGTVETFLKSSAHSSLCVTMHFFGLQRPRLDLLCRVSLAWCPYSSGWSLIPQREKGGSVTFEMV